MREAVVGEAEVEKGGKRFHGRQNCQLVVGEVEVSELIETFRIKEMGNFGDPISGEIKPL